MLALADDAILEDLVDGAWLFTQTGPTSRRRLGEVHSARLTGSAMQPRGMWPVTIGRHLLDGSDPSRIPVELADVQVGEDRLIDSGRLLASNSASSVVSTIEATTIKAGYRVSGLVLWHVGLLPRWLR